MKRTILVAFTVLLFISSKAQLQTGEFAIGGYVLDYATDIIQTEDAGYILTGVKDYNPSIGYILGGTNGMYVVKLDSNGIIQWSHDFPGFMGHRIAINNYYSLDLQKILVIGDFSSTGFDAAIINCYDLSGNLIWTRQLGGAPWICASAYDLTSAGNNRYVIVGGSCTTGTLGDWPNNNGTRLSDGGGINLYRINMSGHIDWFTTIADSTMKYEFFYGNGIIQDKDGGYLITGGLDTNYQISNGLLLKTDSLGNVKWAKKFVGTDSVGTSIVKTNDGGFAIAGLCSPNAPGTVFIEKFDSLYNVQWEKCITSPTVTTYSIRQTDDNGFVLTGEIDSAYNRSDVFLLKLDSLGNYVWSREIGAWDEGGHAVIQTRLFKDKGYAIAGYTYNFGYDTISQYSNNMYFLKLDSMGRSCNSKPLNCTLVNTSNVISNITLQGVYGYDSINSINKEIPADSEVVVCATYVGIPNINNKGLELSVYPNPFTTETTINMGKPGKYYIEVDDMLGRKIESFKYSGQEYKLSSKGLNPDLYIIRVYDEEQNYVSSSKVIVTN